MEMTRREALGAVAVAGVCTPLLAACGAAASAGGDAGTPVSTGTTPTGGITVPTSEVPVGGGVVTNGVVIAQPTAGDFKAYVAICTHENTPLTAVVNGQIICPRHGSRFDIADGSVLQGPAASPLSADKLSVKNGTITVEA